MRMRIYLPLSLLLLTFDSVVAAPCATDDPAAPIAPIALQPIADGLRQPTHVTHAGDGSGRLFVVEQRGVIWIIENGKVLREPFLDIRKQVQESEGEKGLFSIAFHPRYRDNGLFYVDYTSPSDGLHSRLSRFRRLDRNHGDPASETILLKIDQPYANHNGGQLAFGPDGYLYIGMGDGGAGNDPHNHGQNPASLLGKLLRIDINANDGTRAYGIPKDNPFVGKKGYRDEIWATGLRNPWRFSFDRRNGWLFLADVGQNVVEEINVVKKGGNYGWRIMEGDICTPGINPHCGKSGFELPIHVYRRNDGHSITGGFVYRGNTIAGLCGVYVYADYVSRRVWGLRYDGARVRLNRELLTPDSAGAAKLPAISSFGEDEAGELYVADHAGGRILRLVAR